MSVVAHKAEVSARVPSQVGAQVPGQRTKPAVRRVPPGRPPNRRRVAGAPRVLTRSTCARREPRLSLVWMLAVAAVGCAAVFGLGALSSAVGPQVPSATTVVRVLPGENLWELADRVAPQSDAAAVVERIRELNTIDGAVRPGQPLTVPIEG